MTPTQKASLLLKAGLRVREINGQKVFVPKDESQESANLLIKFWQDELLIGKLYEDTNAGYQFADATAYLAEKIGGDAGKALLAYVPATLANPGQIQFRVPIMNVPTLLVQENPPPQVAAVPAATPDEKPAIPEKKSQYIVKTTPERPKIDRAREQVILEAAGKVIPGTMAPVELKTMPDAPSEARKEFLERVEDANAALVPDNAAIKHPIVPPIPVMKSDIPEHWNAQSIPVMKISLDLSGQEIDIRTMLDVFKNMGIVVDRFVVKV